MNEINNYLQGLFNANNIVIPSYRINLFNEFVVSTDCAEVVKEIFENQTKLLEMWKEKNRITDFVVHQMIIPNATVGKEFSFSIDFKKLGFDDINIVGFDALEGTGLSFNIITNTLEGSPIVSGDLNFNLRFNIIGQFDTSIIFQKPLTLIVNSDPRTLWKNLPSDKEDIFWKEDNVTSFGKLGTKHIVVSSKRGRSHQNVGSFRDDDFEFKYFEKTGWSLVVVADGAGSATFARKGSQLACNAVIDYFENHSDIEKAKEFEAKLFKYNFSKDDLLLKEIEVMAKQNLYRTTLFVHNKLKEFADQTYNNHPELFNNLKAKNPIDYFHSTLIFTLFKKYEFGYLIMSFSVGDCPIALMNENNTETTLLNWLDVGEFGGGTRFITQNEIFHSTQRPMSTRFNLKIIKEFSYLFLMTDGIYDAKFEVEVNLEKNEKWIDFIEDLQGKNDNHFQVKLNATNSEVREELSNWMDFWSIGNHDDRTLAIIF